MAQRGRPKKNVEYVDDVNDINTQQNYSSVQQEEEDIVIEPSSSSNTMNEGTFNNYNPFSENVIERDYATPKTAVGVTQEIEEPSFVPPSYEDIIAERNQAEELKYQQDSPFDNPNPAMNELDDKEKRIACESLVDTCLDIYEQAHRYAQYVIKVDEETLMKKQAEGKIDLSMQIPVAENGETMSVGEFVAQYNEQSANAIKYDKEFGYKVRPAMIRVFMKRGWGMTDEQYILLMFGKDITIKFGMMYSLKKTINSTLDTLEKAYQRNNRGGANSSNVDVYERNETASQQDDINDYDIPTYEVEEVENVNETYTQGMNINMPQNPRDSMAQHPKEVQNVLRRTKKNTNDDANKSNYEAGEREGEEY